MPILPATTPKKKLFGDEEKPSLFSNLPTGLEENPTQKAIGSTLQGMLSGSGYDAAKTQNRAAMQTAASALRTQSGAANASFLGQGAANKAQQGVEQSIFKNLSENEMAMNVEEQAMKERGITAATDIGKTQETLNLQQQELEQNAALTREQIASTEKVAGQTLAFDKEKLTETARQFNISEENTVKQAENMLNLNYEQLDVSQKQFLANLGLDQAKFEASKSQFQQQLEQEGRLTMANLSVQEKQIAENARQFDTEAEFKNSELAANMTEAEKNRTWQALQNDKSLQNAVTITQMQTDLETWKTNESAKLTQAGWDVETVNAKLDRDLQDTLSNRQIALEREINNGNLTQKQAELAQQASQFADELSWNKKATELGLNADAAKQVWQTNERIATNAFTANQTSLDRQLEKEIELGRITIQEQELAQSASQFATQQDWEKSKFAESLNEADKARLWESAEKAKDKVYDAQQLQVQQAFTEKGWDYQALLGSLDALPAEQVASTLLEVAKGSGITYDTGEKDADGNAILAPGFKPQAKTEASTSKLSDLWTPGTTNISKTNIEQIIANKDTYIAEGSMVPDNYIETVDPSKWNGHGKLVTSQAAWDFIDKYKNQPYLATNGRLYEVLGGGGAGLAFKDIKTGVVFQYTRGSKFPTTEV